MDAAACDLEALDRAACDGAVNRIDGDLGLHSVADGVADDLGWTARKVGNLGEGVCALAMPPLDPFMFRTAGLEACDAAVESSSAYAPSARDRPEGQCCEAANGP